MERFDVCQPISVILDGSNYLHWADSMMCFLKDKKLWRYVTGDIHLPKKENFYSDDKFIKQLDDWYCKNDQIITWFRNTSVFSISIQFRLFDSAHAAWDYLKERYTATGLTSYYQCLQSVLLMHQEPGESIHNFFSKMSVLWDQLVIYDPTWKNDEDAALYAVLRKKQLLVIFLMALNSEFEPIRASLINRHPHPTLEDALSTLLSEEIRLQTLKNQHLASAVSDGYKDNSYSSSNSVNAQKVCRFCKKPDHELLECTKRVCKWCQKKAPGHFQSDCIENPHKKFQGSKFKNQHQTTFKPTPHSAAAAAATDESSPSNTPANSVPSLYVIDFEAALKQFSHNATTTTEKLDQQHLKMETLNKYGTDLTKLAQDDYLDPVIGRDQQIERVIQILCKRRKNNPCLIGDPGVGKSAIAEGLAQRIANASVPLKLKGNMVRKDDIEQVFSMDMGRLLSGASCRGEFEERLTNMIDEVKQSNGKILLFIDEVHTLIGTGSGGQTLDAANIFKPALARGELKCIGATTLDEYRKHIEKDSALERRFQPIEVSEPSVDETIEILKGLCQKYEIHHNVKYAYEALVSAAHLGHRYIRDRFLPDKAIDLIDETGSRVHLNKPLASTEPQVVTELEVQYIVSSWTGIPIEKVTGEESRRLLKFEESLQKHIVGQEEAVKAISRAIRRSQAGIRDPGRPIASFLFTGPTGVGKTELAKALANEYFGSKEVMVRLDMSEYMEKHTVSKLIGSPPGYIGCENGGQLTEAVRRRPHNLLLFDEIEKAHREIFNAMLQILDDGRLTDNKGRSVDFSNTVIIMTSNIGNDLSANSNHRQLGFKQAENRVAEELKKSFNPEFLNRLDDVIVFHNLTSDQLREILEKMLDKVRERLGAKKIRLAVTEKFKNKLIKEGYSPSYGARPLRRAIMKHLEDNLAERILGGDLQEGDLATFAVDDEDNMIMF